MRLVRPLTLYSLVVLGKGKSNETVPSIVEKLVDDRPMWQRAIAKVNPYQ